ncbi:MULTISPECIES: DinB family protein [unclassified Acinetobacter]|uniref:DinB family protein n=1 Tax=unclassified Acinetobacter TaxID=196816 RepID=UPI0029348D08|nr:MULTISPECIES: DinB family protein [unclassified Acinetobacter]WOE32365.1 DinB family protein [Acinetobacter sp. SAAs470]WOE37838.1 DinB family protein [Acinetobacter sp. SAAs474]
MDLAMFKLLARYNIWATYKLNQQLRQLTEQQFNAECGLYFKSISGTLNHLLVGEHYLWFARFCSQPTPALALNSIIEADKDQLLNQLEQRAQHWPDFLATVDVKKFKQQLTYTTSKGQIISLPYAATLLHVFNHATHHRGQITAALSGMGYDCPELDLVYMLVEENT